MKLLTWLLIVSVVLAVAFAGNIYPASTFKLNENADKLTHNFESLSDSRFTSGYYHVVHPDGRVQVINFLADKNKKVPIVKHNTEKTYHESTSPASYIALEFEATTTRPYITTTSEPGYTSIKDYTVTSSLAPPSFEKQTPFIPIPYTAPTFAATSLYNQPSYFPTYVHSNVDLSTLFRETVLRKSFGLKK